MQNIRLRGEIIAVNRRIGGLEMIDRHPAIVETVNRRIGGLERNLPTTISIVVVNRRIGGLET